MDKSVGLILRHKDTQIYYVFNAARRGRLDTVKLLFKRLSKRNIVELVSTRIDDETPLLVACQHDHLVVAKYLVTECDADVNQVGTATAIDNTVGASPLWCAAAKGNYLLVLTLLRLGASVNCTTLTNSTPLRAACFVGSLEVVECLVKNGADINSTNFHGDTNLMIACYNGHTNVVEYLLKCGADVDRKKNIGKQTAFHECAGQGHLEIVMLLVKHGAKFCMDSEQNTPLLSAAINQHALVVDYLIDQLNCNVVASMYTKSAVIDALEILGSSCIGNQNSRMMEGLDYWRQAMRLRYEDQLCLLEKPITQSAIADFIGAVPEVRTLHELEDFVDVSHPNEIKMQALLVKERVLGLEHSDTIFAIKMLGAEYADGRDYNMSIVLWMYGLEILHKANKPLDVSTASHIVTFTEFLFSLVAGNEFVSFEKILGLFERVIKEMENVTTDDSLMSRIVFAAMHLLGLATNMLPELSDEDCLKLKNAIHHFDQLNPRGEKGRTPLHLACSEETCTTGDIPLFSFPSSQVVDLLLEAGADPNVFDSEKNTPLHLAAMNTPDAFNIFTTLLSKGAHLDACNLKRDYPLSLVINSSVLDINPLQYLNLQCLCAQVIRRTNIPYESKIPRRLKEFLETH